MSLEDKTRKQMEQDAAKCPIAEDVDASFGIIKRTARKFGAKVGLVKHPSAQTIGDIKRGKVGESEGGRTAPPKRRK